MAIKVEFEQKKRQTAQSGFSLHFIKDCGYCEAVDWVSGRWMIATTDDGVQWKFDPRITPDHYEFVLKRFQIPAEVSRLTLERFVGVSPSTLLLMRRLYEASRGLAPIEVRSDSCGRESSELYR